MASRLPFEVPTWLAGQEDYAAFVLGAIVFVAFLRWRTPAGRARLRVRAAAVRLLMAVMVVGWFIVDAAGRRSIGAARDAVAWYAPVYASETEQLGHAKVRLDTTPSDSRYLRLVE